METKFKQLEDEKRSSVDTGSERASPLVNAAKSGGITVDQSSQNARTSEQSLRAQQIEATRRENVLVMRLTTKEQEVQDFLNQLEELRSSVTGGFRQSLLDPAVNIMFEKMRTELSSIKESSDSLRQEWDACRFSADSTTGKKLMAKCRMLHQENEELGKLISSGRIAKLEGDIALSKTFIDALKQGESESEDVVMELDTELEGMTSTVINLQQKLDAEKAKNELLENELQTMHAAAYRTSTTTMPMAVSSQIQHVNSISTLDEPMPCTEEIGDRGSTTCAGEGSIPTSLGVTCVWNTVSTADNILVTRNTTTDSNSWPTKLISRTKQGPGIVSTTTAHDGTTIVRDLLTLSGGNNNNMSPGAISVSRTIAAGSEPSEAVVVSNDRIFIPSSDDHMTTDLGFNRAIQQPVAQNDSRSKTPPLVGGIIVSSGPHQLHPAATHANSSTFTPMRVVQQLKPVPDNQQKGGPGSKILPNDDTSTASYKYQAGIACVASSYNAGPYHQTTVSSSTTMLGNQRKIAPQPNHISAIISPQPQPYVASFGEKSPSCSSENANAGSDTDHVFEGHEKMVPIISSAVVEPQPVEVNPIFSVSNSSTAQQWTSYKQNKILGLVPQDANDIPHDTEIDSDEPQFVGSVSSMEPVKLTSPTEVARLADFGVSSANNRVGSLSATATAVIDQQQQHASSLGTSVVHNGTMCDAGGGGALDILAAAAASATGFTSADELPPTPPMTSSALCLDDADPHKLRGSQQPPRLLQLDLNAPPTSGGLHAPAHLACSSASSNTPSHATYRASFASTVESVNFGAAAAASPSGVTSGNQGNIANAISLSSAMVTSSPVGEIASGFQTIPQILVIKNNPLAQQTHLSSDSGMPGMGFSGSPSVAVSTPILRHPPTKKARIMAFQQIEQQTLTSSTTHHLAPGSKPSAQNPSNAFPRIINTAEGLPERTGASVVCFEQQQQPPAKGVTDRTRGDIITNDDVDSGEGETLIQSTNIINRTTTSVLPASNESGNGSAAAMANHHHTSLGNSITTATAGNWNGIHTTVSGSAVTANKSNGGSMGSKSNVKISPSITQPIASLNHNLRNSSNSKTFVQGTETLITTNGPAINNNGSIVVALGKRTCELGTAQNAKNTGNSRNHSPEFTA